jgi:hypothetical protein
LILSVDRHLEIIYFINHLHMEEVRAKYGDDFDKAGSSWPAYKHPAMSSSGLWAAEIAN